MVRVAIYARYSDEEKQKDTSIEDQVRLCREKAKAEGWNVVEVYADHGISGASIILRPSVQSLMNDAVQGKFDLVLSESLSRLSRDQEEIAGVYKRLVFCGAPLHTLSEGEINELHIGLKGTMNAVFLKDLADAVRRGLRGRIEKGKSGGGISYGYDVVREFDSEGQLKCGERKINEDEADIVRGIFKDYRAGKAPRRIAHDLNEKGVPGPSGRAWGPSTINGNWRRGTGILNNELYVGKLVWNKLRYVKNPDTGKRVSRINPEEEWIIQEVPELQIVDQVLWDEVKKRQLDLRTGHMSFRDKRRPKYLLSHLLKCGCCGGGYSKISATHIGCSTSRNKGLSVCGNRRTMKLETAERSVLKLMQHELMNPALIEEFSKEYTRHINKLRMEHNSSIAKYRAQLAKLEAQEQRMIQAVMDGFANEEIKKKLNTMDARKAELRSYLENETEERVLIHPSMANRYRDEVKSLVDSINSDEHLGEAIEHLRSLIDRIVLTPDPNGEGLLIDLYGDLPGILNLSANKSKPGHAYTEQEIKRIRLIIGMDAEGHESLGDTAQDGSDGDGSYVNQVQMVAEAGNKTNLISRTSQVEVVAGAGFEPATFRL